MNRSVLPSVLRRRSRVMWAAVAAGTLLAATGASQAQAQAPVSFNKKTLSGETSTRPTSLQWGPDGRLYVASQYGVIKAYTVARAAATGAYSVTATETVELISTMPNRNDDGTLSPSTTGRLVTGLLVKGSAASPVIYVNSSDPRIGAGPDGDDLNLDTNSGIISRLTKSGATWTKQDLVRGLPRSEENHTGNGLALSPDGTKLYLAQGGNTNKGGPSNNFARLPEYALSAAILQINLATLPVGGTYDLPTLDDESRAGVNDANDPFGGNNGKNQAKLVPGGPVSVYSPGYRNPYDVIFAADGSMYSIDNGGNAGWGDVPIGEGPAGTCTNGIAEPGTTGRDHLHRITGPGYYAGHPNPTRANMANTFNTTNPQSPVSTNNAVECDFLSAGDSAGNGIQNGALVSFGPSTNGLAEYTASNFANAMKGNLVAASYDNSIQRIVLGATTATKSALASTVGAAPLDVTTMGDAAAFPGTIWIADVQNENIYILEPGDYGGGTPACDLAQMDSDGDGFANTDETANGTDPCSAASIPPDADGDKISDLTDPNDDNDSLPDVSDPFAVDAQNGLSTSLPVEYLWENEGQSPGGLLELGFTGLMTNGVTNYLSQFDPDQMTVGGAAGVTTVDAVPNGDAYTTSNSQQYGFQFGIPARPAGGAFTVRTRVVGPFAGLTPTDFQSMGLFIGTGDQDNYVKIVTAANGGTGIQALAEIAGAAGGGVKAPVVLPGPDYVDLYLLVNPATNTVQPSYTVTQSGTTSARANVGPAITVPASWFTAADRGLAVGILSTSNGPGVEFPATWDFVEVTPEGSTPPPADATVADTFTRTAANGWGSAETGGAWSVLSGTGANYSVTGGKGTIAVPGSAAQRLLHLGSTSIKDLDLKATLNLGTVNGSGGNITYAIARRQASGTYQRVGLVANSSGTLLIRGQTDTGATLFADINTGLTYNPATDYKLRIQLEGSSPTTYRVKAWPATATEPSAWTATATSSAGPQTAGSIGFRMLTTATGAWTAKVDDLTVGPIGGTTPPPAPTGLWQTKASSPTNRQEVSYVQVNGQFYLTGGSQAHQKYDPVSNTWSAVANLPQWLDHIQGVTVGGKIYYIGGLSGWPAPHVSTVYIYDPVTNTYTQGAPMTRGRGGGGVAVYNGKIYYAGGLADGVATNWFDVYDPVANTWQQLPNMPTTRDHFQGAVADGRFWAIGGRNTQISAMTTVNEAFNFQTGQWETGFAPLPTARGGFAVANIGDELFVIGGEAPSKTFNEVEAYNVKTNTWRTLNPMPTSRHGIQGAVCNGGIYITAGGTTTGGGNATNVQEVLFPGGTATTCPQTQEPPVDPPPADATVADTFTRTAANGWGSAETGGAWSVLSGTGANYSVTGGKGTIAVPGSAAQRLLHLGSTSIKDLDLKATLNLGTVNGSGGNITYAIARRQASGTYQRVGLVANSSGTLLIRGQTDTGATLFADINTGLTYNPATDYKLRIQLEGSSPTTYRVKAWPATATEPSAWTGTATSSAGPQTAGSIGFRMLTTATGAWTAKVDDLTVGPIGTTPPPPPPPPPGAVADTYARTVADGWGSADTGGAWSVLFGTPASFSVSGGQGAVVTPGNAQRVIHLGSTSLADIDLRADVTLSAGTGNFVYAILRRQASGAYQRIGLTVTGGQIHVRGQSDTGAALFPDTNTAVPYAASTVYRLRVQAVGSSPTAWKVKLWPATADEPNAWNVEISSSVGPQTAGSVGWRMLTTTAAAFTATVDNLTAAAP